MFIWTVRGWTKENNAVARWIREFDTLEDAIECLHKNEERAEFLEIHIYKRKVS